MTTNEREIAIHEGHKIHAETSYFTPRPQLDFENARHVFGEGFDIGYIAATAEANKRIAELEGEVAELKELLSDRTQDLEFEYNRAEENFLSCGILQSEIDKLNEINEGINCPVCGSLAVSPKEIWYTKQIAALQASNNHLREALEDAANDIPGWFDKYKQALSATPAESLQVFKNELLERVAKVCEGINLNDEEAYYGRQMAAAIRKLKTEVK